MSKESPKKPRHRSWPEVVWALVWIALAVVLVVVSWKFREQLGQTPRFALRILSLLCCAISSRAWFFSKPSTPPSEPDREQEKEG